MIQDTKDGTLAIAERYDTCIVGAGPAGISLALRLAEAGQRVVLVEGGGREFTGESQELYEGALLGLDYDPLDAPRLRYLGGTTGHWGGQCLLLDPFDFEPREDVPLSGWPIRIDALAPYEAEAARVTGTATFGHVRRAADETGNIETIRQNWSSDRRFWEITNNEPVRFGKVYGADLAASEAVDTFLNANLVGLEVDAAAGRITAAELRDYGEGRYSVRADRFVLAMGGLENCRFLLHLNDLHGDRLGNQGGMVGRCFMEHQVVQHGAYFITRRLYSHSPTWEFERLLRRDIPELLLSPSHDFVRARGILNSTVRLNRLFQRPLSEQAAAESDFIKGLGFDEDYFFTGHTWIVGEQAPNPASRVVLVDETDRYGIRRIGLDWRLSPIDRRTLRESTLEAARFLIRTGLGRMQIEPRLWDAEGPPPPYDYSRHHMGGARMSETPETGVVDADCKVHGVPNLFVAGSAVFATSGHANPTFTIVQLALRLADHLAARPA